MPLPQLSSSINQFYSICSASSLPCTQSIYSTGLPELQPEQESFPFSSKMPSQRAASSRLRVSLLSMVGWVICVLLGEPVHQELGLAVRSPPNLFLGNVLEDAPGKHFSPLQRSVEPTLSLASPSLAGAGCCSPDPD